MITPNEDIVWDDVSKAEWILRNNWHEGLPYYFYNTTTNKLSLQNMPPWVSEDSAFCEAYISASAEEKSNFLKTGKF